MPLTVPPRAITLEKIPPLPAAVWELMRSLDDGNANFAALAKRIGQDPALTARVLRVVNSPFYGLSGRVGSLSEAVMVLGFSAIRNMAMAASLADRFHFGSAAGIEPRRIWEHSFTCAMAAQSVARLVGESPDTAFTAGLLHDIGIIAILAQAPECYAELISVADCDIARDDTEKRLFGTTHGDLGACLLATWRLPEGIVNAVRWHHDPARGGEALGDLLFVADLIAHERASISLPDPDPGRTEEALARLQLDWKACSEVLQSLDAQVAAMTQMLKDV